MLLIFVGSLAKKCVCLSNEPCMDRPAVIDLNHIYLNYYPFMISLDRCDKVVMLLMIYLQTYVFPVKQKM